MLPETKFKSDKRVNHSTSYKQQNSIYQNVDNYINSKNDNGLENNNYYYSRDKENYYGTRSMEHEYEYEKRKEYNNNSSQRKFIDYNNVTKQNYNSQPNLNIAQKMNYNQNNNNSKTKTSLAAYNIIPKSLLEIEKKQSPATKENVKPNIKSSQNQHQMKRNSISQYSQNSIQKSNSSKRNSINYENNFNNYNINSQNNNTNNNNNNNNNNYRMRSVSYQNKPKNENMQTKPKLGVIGVLSAKKSLNEFSKRSSKVLSQQSEEINSLKARIQELTMDHEIMKKLNQAQTENTLLEFHDKYLSPLISKMSTYLMKFSSEYKEMIKSNSNFLDSQHDRTEILVELAAELNSQLHSFIEDFECDRFDEQSFYQKRIKVDNIAETTTRLNSQLARIALQLDDQRESPDFQKVNMTNSIQSLNTILQQLNNAAITVNNKISDYETSIKEKDYVINEADKIIFEKEQENSKLEEKIIELKSIIENDMLLKELNEQNEDMNNERDEMIIDNEKEYYEKIEKYRNDLAELNYNLTNVTLLFDTDSQQKTKIIKEQNQKIKDITDSLTNLNGNLANVTLLFDSEIKMKNDIINDYESQISKLKQTSANINTNLSLLSLLYDEKMKEKNGNIEDLKERIENLQIKCCDMNSNLLKLTDHFNTQMKEKNEQIELNKKDAIYFRDFSRRLNDKMMFYLGDFLQRIWDKNHENKLLLEKNEELKNLCVDLNNRVAKFTLEIDELQKEKKQLLKELTNHSIQEDETKIEFYKNMAVDLNNRLAVLSLEMNEILINKYSTENDQVNVISSDLKQDNNVEVEYYKNQATELNSKLAKLTLDYNEFQNETIRKNNSIKSTIDKMEYYKNMAVDLNTRLSVLTLEIDEIKNQNQDINIEDKIRYYQELVNNLNKNIVNITEKNIKNIKEIQNKYEGEIEHYHNIAVDLNSRLAVLTLNSNEEINKLKQELNNKNNQTSMSNEQDNSINKYKTQSVDLNQKLTILTLNSDEEIKNLKKEIQNKDTYIEQLNQKLSLMNQQIINLKNSSNMDKNHLSEKEEIINNLQNKLNLMYKNDQKNNSIGSPHFNETPNEYEKELSEEFKILHESNKRLSNGLKRKSWQFYNLKEQMIGINNGYHENIKTLQCKLDEEKIKNNKLQSTINLICNEIQSIAKYINNTKLNLTDIQKELQNKDKKEKKKNSIVSGEILDIDEILAITDYLKETKQYIEELKKTTLNDFIHNQNIHKRFSEINKSTMLLEQTVDKNEILSISNYINETKKYLEELKMDLLSEKKNIFDNQDLHNELCELTKYMNITKTLVLEMKEKEEKKKY